MFWVMTFLFPSSYYVCCDPAFQEVSKHLPDDGNEGINPLFCYPCAHSFASLTKLFLS